MMRSLWIAKTGLDAQQTQLDIITNNLANVSTNGYKRQRGVFEDLLYENVRQPGGQSSQQSTIPTGLQLGTGVKPVSSGRIFTQGGLQQTGNQFDMAINGHGFFQIAMPDGTVSYTRDGSFQVDAAGQLANANGFALSPAISVPPTATAVTIGQDGTVTAKIAGQTNTQTIGTIQLVNFVNPAGLLSIGGNLYSETTASGTPSPNNPGTNGLGTLNQGYVESSNVNVVEELVSMIQTQRSYEINSKAITTSDQMLQRLAQA